MSSDYLTPGVYVDEVATPAPSIERKAFQVGALIGKTAQGPVGTPVRATSLAEFRNTFGGDIDATPAPDARLPWAVEGFFANGGKAAWIVRTDPRTESRNMPDELANALEALNSIEEIALIAAPGLAIPEAQQCLIGHCEGAQGRFAILDVPLDSAASEAVDHRGHFDTPLAALYHPWLLVRGRRRRELLPVPPSGAVMGAYFATDAARGLWKAPANVALRGATGLTAALSQHDLGMLTRNHVNGIRMLRAQGIRIWGARTLSKQPELRYVPVSRTQAMIRNSVSAAIATRRQRPNTPELWSELRTTVDNFLNSLWRDGALQGPTPDAAYFVRIGQSQTMSPAEVADGVIRIELGLAFMRPGEFILLRVEGRVAPPASPQ